MDIFWIFVTVIAVALIVFLVLPKVFDHPTMAQPIRAPKPVPSQTQHEAAERAHEVAVASAQSQAALDAVFEETRATEVPENYPLRPIGACPYSKADSTSLPMVDTPRCILLKGLSA